MSDDLAVVPNADLRLYRQSDLPAAPRIEKDPFWDDEKSVQNIL
jgi:hypothetical protein